MITSLQNPRVKDALKLRRRKGRDNQGRFPIDGLREIEQAIAGEIPFDEAFHCPSLVGAATPAVVERLQQAGCPVSVVSESVWQKINYGNRQDGLLAIARHPLRTLVELQPRASGPLIVLDRIEKPGNVGAIVRTATAAGASALLVCDPGTDLFNPNAIRASLGTIFRLPTAVCRSEEAYDWLKEHSIDIHVARVDATHSAFESDLTGRCALVVGNEAKGVSAPWLDETTHGIVLPMAGPIDSLNVANSAAILIYESLRQRTKKQESRSGKP